jgi:hypothetical protein
MMPDKAQRQQLRNYYGIRNTRSKKFKELIPNLNSLTNKEIYDNLQKLYIMESNKRYNASFNALLFLSEATKGNNYEHEPIAVPNKIVKSKFVFDILQEIYKIRTYYRINVNGNEYFVLTHEQAEQRSIPFIDLNNYAQAELFISQYFTLQQVPNKMPNATPILYSKALKLEFTVNAPNETGFGKLCRFNEILNPTKGTRKHARIIDELIETTVSICGDYRLYETNEIGDMQYFEINDELEPIQVDITRENIIKYGITKEILFKLCEY